MAVQKEFFYAQYLPPPLPQMPHRSKGREYRKCSCPINLEGALGDKYIRESLGIRSWDAAQARVRELEAQSLFGFAFQTVQADNGPEFATWLKDMLGSKQIQLRHSRVRQSNDNAHIERFNRTIQQELLGTRPLRGQVTQARIDEYIHYYNYDRLHLGISLQTPKEVATKQPA